MGTKMEVVVKAATDIDTQLIKLKKVIGKSFGQEDLQEDQPNPIHSFIRFSMHHLLLQLAFRIPITEIKLNSLEEENVGNVNEHVDEALEVFKKALEDVDETHGRKWKTEFRFISGGLESVRSVLLKMPPPPATSTTTIATTTKT